MRFAGRLESCRCSPISKVMQQIAQTRAPKWQQQSLNLQTLPLFGHPAFRQLKDRNFIMSFSQHLTHLDVRSTKVSCLFVNHLTLPCLKRLAVSSQSVPCTSEMNALPRTGFTHFSESFLCERLQGDCWSSTTVNLTVPFSNDITTSILCRLFTKWMEGRRRETTITLFRKLLSTTFPDDCIMPTICLRPPGYACWGLVYSNSFRSETQLSFSLKMPSNEATLPKVIICTCTPRKKKSCVANIVWVVGG